MAITPARRARLPRDAGVARLRFQQRLRARLTGPVRIDPVLVLVLALAFGATASVAPAPTLTAACIAFVALRRQLGRRGLALCVLGLGIGWARAGVALGAHDESWRAARAAFPAPARCAGTAFVTSSPTWIGGSLRLDVKLEALDCNGASDERVWPARLYVPGPPGMQIARGDVLSVIADLAPTSEFRNFDVPDTRPGATRREVVLSGAALSVEVEGRAFGLRALLDRARAHVRERIVATFGATVTGMARALVLGENDLDPEDERAFQRSGLSHLLAVSGTHLILAVLALVRGAEAVLRRWEWLAARSDVRRPAALFGMCLAPLYADFAGGSGSAWRAAWMLCAVLGVRALGRHVLPSRILAASLGAGWACDGLVVFDPSFALSMAATTGLLAMGRRLEESLFARATALTEPRRPDLGRLTRALTRAALTTLSATLPCVPILLSISPGISLASVAANLLAAPLGEAVALPLCLLHAVCWPLPSLERGVALVATGALASIRGVARASAAVDWLYIELPPPSAWHLACAIAGAALCLGASGRPWLSRVGSPPTSRAPGAFGDDGRESRSANDGLSGDGGDGGPVSHAAADDLAAIRASGASAASSASAARSGRRVLGAPGWAAVSVAMLLVVEAATRFWHSAAYGRWAQRMRVTALDVGQGDATLVDLPDGRLMLIDGGGMVGVPVDPGERVILPVLRARRRQHLDVVVLTHPHPDHYGGLLSVVSQVSVGEFWYGNPPSGSGSPERGAVERGAIRGGTAERRGRSGSFEYARLFELLREHHVELHDARQLCVKYAPRDEASTAEALAAAAQEANAATVDALAATARGANASTNAALAATAQEANAVTDDALVATARGADVVTEAAPTGHGPAGKVRSIDAATPTAMAAPTAVTATERLSIEVLHPCPDVDSGEAANDNSLVLRIRHGAHAALLVGDAEHWAEQRLLATHAESLRADFLKVGHHGSRTSSGKELLARVAPRWATISCGVRNRFGHPHPEALARLEQAGIDVLRLDQRGAVKWETDGKNDQVRTVTSLEKE